MQKACEQCGNEFAAKRSTAKYCGDACRGKARTLSANGAHAKRGKDVVCFEDLHPAVQATIKALSDTDEELRLRTAAAIQYQHVFPDRYAPLPAYADEVTGKPGDPEYPEQSGLSTCKYCGHGLAFDVLSCCRYCAEERNKFNHVLGYNCHRRSDCPQVCVDCEHAEKEPENCLCRGG